MKNEVSFSIIVVTFNAVDVIDKTIKSIISQSYENFEILCIDGLSTDNTVKVLNEHATDSRLKIFSEKDSGIYHAMNKGMDLAKGKYVLYLNAGDYFVSRSILANVIQFLGKDVIVGNAIYKYHREDEIRNPQSLDNLWKGMTFNHQCAFYKLSTLRQFRFNLKYRISSVHEQTIRLAKSDRSFEFIDIPISYYDPYGLSSIFTLWVRDYMRIVFINYPQKLVFIVPRVVVRYVRYLKRNLWNHFQL